MGKYKVRLDTMADVTKFVSLASQIPAPVYLIDKDSNFKVSAKSLLGAVYTMEWGHIYCISDSESLYNKIQEFVINE